MKNPSVDDLRAILIKSGKYTPEQAELIKGKSKLTDAVLALETSEDHDVSTMFQEVEVESDFTDNSPPGVVRPEPNPAKNSPEWQNFVLAQFRQEELDDKYPKLVGLRRVAQELVGEIISSMPIKLDTIVDDRNPCGRSSCIYEVVFDTLSGEKVKFGAAASSWSGNTDDEFQVYTEAIAESRAEARALRKALNLNTVSRDEMPSPDKNIKEIVRNLSAQQAERSGSWSEDDDISTSQKFMIQKTCDRLGIDLNKFLAQEKLNDIDTIKKKDAASLIELLNKYQSTSKDSIVIPVEIKR